MEEQFGRHVDVDAPEYFRSEATPTMVPVSVTEPAAGVARRSDRLSAKSRRARLSLIRIAPGVSTSSNQRPATSDMPIIRPKFAETELTGAALR